jgi:hypothetical protein
VTELDSGGFSEGANTRGREKTQTLWARLPGFPEANPSAARLSSRYLFLVAIALAFVASVALRSAAGADETWLIMMCERILHGERAYVDIFETNPPIAVLLYMPGVLAAKLTGVTPEAATFAFAYASTALSLWLSSRTLPKYVVEGGQSRWLVLMPAAVVLLILPRNLFAQREYFAAAFSLPMVSVFIRHAQQKEWPPLSDRIVAAVLAGLALAIKPPIFALPGVFVAGYYWWRTRNLLFLLPSGLLAAGGIALSLTAVSLMAFPDYLGEVSVVMREAYVPIRAFPLLFLADKGCLGVLACLGSALALSLRDKPPPVAAVLASLAALGFLAAYFIQGKYFNYHVFPAAPFAAVAACIMMFKRVRQFADAPRASLAAASAVFFVDGIVIAALFFAGFEARQPMMRDLSWAKDLDHPRALAVTPLSGLTLPTARRIGAVWVSRTHSQEIAWFTRFALQSVSLTEAERRRYLYWHDRDLRSILSEIKEKTPELIFMDTLSEFSWLKMELSAMEPGFLDSYQVVAEENGVAVLRLKASIRAFPDRLPEAARQNEPWP